MQYPCPGDGAVKIPLAGNAEVIFYVFDQIPMARDVAVGIATRRASRQIDDMPRGINAADALTGQIPEFEIQDFDLPLQGNGAGSLSAAIASGGGIIRTRHPNRILLLVVKAIGVAWNGRADSIVPSQNARSARA